MKIAEMYADERPREKLIEKGPGALSSSELLAILLRTGTREKNAVEVARDVLASCDGSLDGLWSKSEAEMEGIPGIGKAKAVTLCAAMELCRRLFEEKTRVEEPLTSALQVYNMMLPWIKGLDHEECWVLYLDNANRCMVKEKITSGSGVQTVIDTRQVLKKAIARQACSIILVHNHPNGNAVPSPADVEETRKLQLAVKPFNIGLLDHVIIAGPSFFSFNEDGTFDSRGRRVKL